MKMLKRLMLSIVILACIPVALAAGRDVENHPGFVDFSRLAIIAGTEPKVEISLKAPLLNMITNLIRNEDEQAAEFISKLLRVTVNVYASNTIDVDEISGSMSSIADDLDSQGWDRVVRIREDSDHVDIYFRLSEDALVIYGIAIMVAGPNEVVLVNIVGDINTDDISALGRRFNIDELVDLDLN